MKPVVGTLLLILALIPAQAQSPVPVRSEPRHHFKFENKHVRVFDVVVPRGDATLFHTHSNDYVFVSIGDANLKAEVMGNPPGDLILKDGEVRYTKATITHRVTNQSQSPFRNITIEILAPVGTSASNNPLSKVPGYSLLFENDRVRAWRLVLGPDQSTEIHSHDQPWLSVAVSEGNIIVESPGKKPGRIVLKPGEFKWHDAGEKHSIKNAGKGRFEAVDIEWK